MHIRRFGLVALAFGIVANTAIPAMAAERRPTGANQIVVQISTAGGFVPLDIALGEFPELTVYGDGRMVFLGPTTLEYPGPALANVRELWLTPEGITRLLRLAREAGLLDRRPPDYGSPDVTDNPSTFVTVNAHGKPKNVTVYALGFDDDDLSDGQRENRRRLQRFITATQAVPRRFVAQSEDRYEPTELAVHIGPVEESSGLEAQHVWPLPALGGQMGGGYDATAFCTTVTGAEMSTVIAAASKARQGDIWSFDGGKYQLVFRPLLPLEPGCNVDYLVRIRNQPNGWGGANTSFKASEVTVYLDGRIVVVPAPVGDSVPAPTEIRVDEDALARIEQAARDAGLAGPPLDYGEPGITDQGSTLVDVVAGGELRRVAVYALGMENVDDDHLGLTPAQLRARRHLAQFIDLVTEIGSPS